MQPIKKLPLCSTLRIDTLQCIESVSKLKLLLNHLIVGKHLCENYMSSFFRFKWSQDPFFGYRPLDLCSCQFEPENVCSKDLDPPASKRACAVPTLLEKFEAELIAATQRPPTGNQNAPNFLLSRITHPCLPIVAFKLLWRPLFASRPPPFAVSSVSQNICF